MNGYDVVVLLIMIIATVQGAWRGMSWQLAPIASLVLGYMIAFPASKVVAPWFGQPPYNQLLALVVVYLAIALGVYLVARSIRSTIERFKLIEFDRHVGILLGLAKGVLFSLAMTFLILAVVPKSREFILPSYSGHLAAVLMDYAHPLIPQAMHNILHPYVHELGRARRDAGLSAGEPAEEGSPAEEDADDPLPPFRVNDSTLAESDPPRAEGSSEANSPSDDESSSRGYEELEQPPKWAPPVRTGSDGRVDWDKTRKSWEAETQEMIDNFLKEAARLPPPRISETEPETSQQ